MIIRKRSDRVPYVLESERDSDDKTTFYLRPLTKRQFMSFGIEAQTIFKDSDEGVTQDQADFMYVKLSENLIGWENVKDEDGNHVAFDSTNVEGILEDLDFEVLSELFAALTETNSLTEEESKNSE